MIKNNKKPNIQGEFPAQIVEHEDGFSIICYQLNLASQGETVEEAMAMFREALDIFIEDLNEEGCLEEVMIEAGFKVEIEHEGSPIKIIIPPTTTLTTIKIPDLA